MRGADLSDMMEEMCSTVNRLKVWDIIFLDPHRINRHCLLLIDDLEYKSIYRLTTTHGQSKLGEPHPTVQQDGVLSVGPLCQHGQRVFERIVQHIVHFYRGLYRTIYALASHKAHCSHHPQSHPSQLHHIFVSI